MKRNIKKNIKKRIEIIKSGNDRDVKKIISTPTILVKKKPVKVNNNIIRKKSEPVFINKFEKRFYERTGLIQGELRKKKKKKHVPVYFDFPLYEKLNEVDFDVAICISSFDRYSKIKYLLNQIYSQKSNYTYKVFFINDGSSSKSYSKLKKSFPDMIYLENKINGGKYNYWKTLSNLWLKVKDYNTHALCQIDDDFILCDNFLNILMDKFFDIKERDNSFFAFRYHLGHFENREFNSNNVDSQCVDGGTLYDINLIKKIDYKIPKTNITNHLDNAKVWDFITYRIREYGMKVYFLKKSLALHNGNEDSKLHPIIRGKKKIKSYMFVDKTKITKDDV